MANINTSSGPFLGTEEFTDNVSAATAGTEYSYALPDNTTQFKLRSRKKARIQIAYQSGDSGLVYFSLMPGNVYEINNVLLTDVTIYFQSYKDNDTIEIQGFTL
jgi:hypothetical protein